MIFQENFFKERADSDKILEFTFMLPPTSSNDELKALAEKALGGSGGIVAKEKYSFREADLKPWVEECFSFTHDVCKFCLPNYNSEDTFFHIGHPPLNQSANGYSVLESSNRFWYFILRQNAIMSAYDKLRRYLSASNPLRSGADFLKFLLPFGADCNKDNNHTLYGLYFLLTHSGSDGKPLATLNDSGILKAKVSPRNTSKQKSYYRSRNSSLTKHANELYSIISNQFNTGLIKLSNKSSEVEYPLLQINTLELYQFLANRKEGKKNINLKTIFGMHRQGSVFDASLYDKYVLEYQHIRNNLKLPAIDTNQAISYVPGTNLELVDKLYCRYLIEKELGLELSDCLYQNILSHPKKDYLVGIINFISSCFTLPNPFGRQLILQTALDNLRFIPTVSVHESEEEYVHDPDDITITYYDNYHDSEMDYFSNDPFDDEDDFITIRHKDAAKLESVRSISLDDIERLISENDNRKKEMNALDKILEFDSYHTDKALNSQTEDIKRKDNKYSDVTRIQLENSIWESNYNSIINKLTKYIFPLYDNYFFNVLWNSVRPLCSFSNYDERGDKLCAVRLFKLLSAYLNNPNTINTLFNEDTLFATDSFPLAEYSKEGIIKPFPQLRCDAKPEEQNVDIELYQRCVQASVYAKTSVPVPDFLSLEYMFPNSIGRKTLTDDLEKAILFHNT